VEKSKVGWRAHMHIGDLSRDEVNFVKADREILLWFLSQTHIFMWSTSEEKEIWIKPLQPKPDVINANIYHIFYV
jgi:hypothetical protein